MFAVTLGWMLSTLGLMQVFNAKVRGEGEDSPKLFVCTARPDTTKFYMCCKIPFITCIYIHCSSLYSLVHKLLFCGGRGFLCISNCYTEENATNWEMWEAIHSTFNTKFKYTCFFFFLFRRVGVKGKQSGCRHLP